MGTRSLSLAIVLLALVPASAAANSTEIIVKREAGLSTAERADIRSDAEVRYVESLALPRTELVVARPGDVQDAISDLNADPDVVYAERNRPVQAPAADTHMSKLWGLENLGDFSLGSARATPTTTPTPTTTTTPIAPTTSTPQPPPAQVSSISATAKQHQATLRVVTSRQATVGITVERRSGRRWVRVTRKTVATAGNRATLKVKRLKRGKHRARASVSGGTPVTEAFRVR